MLARIDALAKYITFVCYMLTRIIVAHNKEVEEVKEPIGHLLDMFRGFYTQGTQPPPTSKADKEEVYYLLKPLQMQFIPLEA